MFVVILSINVTQHSDNTARETKLCKITDDQIMVSIKYAEYYTSRLITGTRFN